MFWGCLQDFSRMFLYGGIWWSFQMKVWTLMIQRNSMIHNYSMISAIRWSLAIRWSPAIRWFPAIWWSIGSIDFDNPKVYGDTSIFDGHWWLLLVIQWQGQARIGLHAVWQKHTKIGLTTLEKILGSIYRLLVLGRHNHSKHHVLIWKSSQQNLTCKR